MDNSRLARKGICIVLSHFMNYQKLKFNSTIYVAKEDMPTHKALCTLDECMWLQGLLHQQNLSVWFLDRKCSSKKVNNNFNIRIIHRGSDARILKHRGHASPSSFVPNSFLEMCQYKFHNLKQKKNAVWMVAMKVKTLRQIYMMHHFFLLWN